MIKMSSKVMRFCVALFIALTSVSAVQRLDLIHDLKKIDFGRSVPKHSLVLLYWFANTVDINNNNIIWLTFDPNRGDYGSHHYGNYEGLLDPLPRGNIRYMYYTIGNLHQETSVPLPPYVVNPPTEYVGTNRDRIIIRVRQQNTLQRIDQVYITQHYDISEYQGTPYDPEHTYRISINLLRQIREFSVGQNQQQLLRLRNRHGSNADDSQLRNIRNTWGVLACLGLLLFIVIEEKYFVNQHNYRRENNNRPENYNRPEYNADRPENYNSPEPNADRPEHRQNHWADDAFAICCLLTCILFSILIFFSILVASR
ncbi:uncharacterized protein LOC121956294 [Plectropomus leopardus]|uniref:uncharacterized protein LOC121956294 n=1 Tax=Plectropomus leopardus TaxID=160734 RepID=UPI001C4C34D9|nr:uncharacterized protein LOC121956294 [Plectropomus leopardus]